MLQLFKLLNRYYTNVWLDRFNISLSENWDKRLITARDQASYAVVVLSDEYLKTHYSRVEFDTLVARNIPIIAIVIDDLSTELLADIQPHYWIDCRTCHEEHMLRANMGSILEHLPSPEERINLPERTDYLRNLITDQEIKLSVLPTSRAAAISHDYNARESYTIRQRGYDNELLTQWYFTHQNGDSIIEVTNILSWFEAQPQFVLCGPSGSGKTVITQLLVLQGAHDALQDTATALPIWLDLTLWDEYKSFEEFIESQWPLAFYWKHWLDTNQAFIVFDNWSDFRLRHPDRIDALNSWIEAAPNHKIIILTQDETHVDLNLPILHIDSVPINQIPRFIDEFLQGRQKDILKRLVSEYASKVRFSTLDYICCGIELVAMNSDMAVDTWHKNPIKSIIALRWQHHIEDDDAQPTFSLDYFIATLQTLAWNMLQKEQYRFISFDVAKQLLLGETPIHVALDLGLLIMIGDQLRFQSSIFQWHLAAQHLASDGIYKHLSRPKFLSNGKRQTNKYDEVVLALVDQVSDEQSHRIIDQVAEIDPFLAYNSLRRYPDLYKASLQPIIAKLIEACGKNPTSQTALSTILHQIPYVEDTAITLMQQMPNLDWGSQKSLWQDLLQLPLDIPPEFKTRIRRIERNFPDSAFDLLSDSPSLQYVAYLAHMIYDDEIKIQRNAIWISGQLEPLAMQVGLFELLDDPSKKIRQAVFSALSNVRNDDSLVKQLLIWLRTNPEYSGDVGNTIYQIGRPVSGSLLKLTHDTQLTVDDELRNVIIKYPEEDIAIVVAQFIVTDPEMQIFLNKMAEERQNVMKVQKLLHEKLQQLPRDGLNRIFVDINRVLKINPDDESYADESLYQRTQSAILAANTIENVELTLPDIPESVTSDLESKDQQLRQEAVEELPKYQFEQVIPLLLKSIDDKEVKVQIAAVRGLAELSQHEIARHALISTLFHENPVIIDTATNLLKSLDYLDGGELLHLLGTDSVQTLTAVIDIMGYTRYEEAVPYLILCLDDERKTSMSEKTISDYVAEALIAIGTPDALDAVNQSSYVQSPSQNTDTATVVAAQAVTENTTLAQTPLDEIELLVNALRSNNWETAQEAARDLRDLVKKQQGTDDIELVQTLCEALSDPNEHVRWAVAEALAWLQHPAAIPYLVDHMGDPEWTVQAAVIRSLAKLKASDYAPGVALYLNHEYHVVREAATEALGELGNPIVIPKLDQLSGSDDEFLRLAAIQSIYQINNDDMVDYLIKALHDDDIHVRWFAMKHLVDHARPSDAVEIARMLLDKEKPPWEETTISEYATQALIIINSPKSKAILDKWSALKKRKQV